MRYFLTLAVLCITLCGAKHRVLHLSMHNSCVKEISYLAKQMDFDLVNWNIMQLTVDQFDGRTKGCDRYNIDHFKAAEIWKRNRDFFDTFDLVITSDTAPLARIFLQNGWKKPLIIWVCNRFDYSDEGSKKCHFPDKEFYQLFESATNRPNVRVISYTDFEHVYASEVRGLTSWSKTIKPIGAVSEWKEFRSIIPSHVNPAHTFFIPPYHNDTHLLNPHKHLTRRGIANYRGRYAGPMDLKNFKGIIHIPYAWSNIALFENWANGVIYFIPSERFLMRLAKGNFFWSPPFGQKWLKHSEWYLPAHKDLFVYFDSWKDLKNKVLSTDYPAYRKRILEFSKQHEKRCLDAWNQTFQSLGL